MINNDFYYDEAITLTTYVYKSLHDVIFHYVNLNNHFLFSVMANIYVHVFKIHLYTLLDHPYLIRLPMGIFALITLYYLYKLGGWMSVLILCTTLPYLYYIFALRGYSLSIMLMTILLYYLDKKYHNKNNYYKNKIVSFIDPGGVVHNHTIKDYNPYTSVISFSNSYSNIIQNLMIIIITALFCYVMPSNYAFIIILLLFYVGQPQGKAIIVGLILSLIMYSPVYSGIGHDPIVNQHLFNWSTLTSSLPQTLNAFISYRYLLIIPVIVGWLHYDLKDSTLCIVMCLLPFVLFFVQGGHVYDRIIFPALPFFCLFIGRGLDNCLRLLNDKVYFGELLGD